MDDADGADARVEPERLEFTASPWIGPVAVAAIALAGGVWGATRLDGWLAIACAVGAAVAALAGVAALVRAMRRAPVLVLTRDGLHETSVGTEGIPWTEIDAVWAGELHGRPVLCLRLRDAERVLAPVPAPVRAFLQGARGLGLGDLVIGFAGLRPGLPAALEFAERVRGESGGLRAAEVQALALDWCEFQRTFATSPEFQRRRAVVERIDALCRAEPESAWAVLVEIARIEVDHDILGTLAQGPLATLIVHHGSGQMDAIEAQARRDPKLRGLLARCSPEGLDAEVWSRLLAVSGRGA